MWTELNLKLKQGIQLYNNESKDSGCEIVSKVNYSL